MQGARAARWDAVARFPIKGIRRMQGARAARPYGTLGIFYLNDEVNVVGHDNT